MDIGLWAVTEYCWKSLFLNIKTGLQSVEWSHLLQGSELIRRNILEEVLSNC